MAGLEIIYQDEHVFIRCLHMEQAYFIGSMLSLKPYSYLYCIESFSNHSNVTITPPYNDITITIYFGMLIPYQVRIISMEELFKIEVFCERAFLVNEFKKKKKEEKTNRLLSYTKEDSQSISSTSPYDYTDW